MKKLKHFFYLVFYNNIQHHIYTQQNTNTPYIHVQHTSCFCYHNSRSNTHITQRTHHPDTRTQNTCTPCNAHTDDRPKQKERVAERAHEWESSKKKKREWQRWRGSERERERNRENLKRGKDEIRKGERERKDRRKEKRWKNRSLGSSDSVEMEFTWVLAISQ